VLLHVNWVTGAEAKRFRLREIGAWTADGEERFRAPFCAHTDRAAAGWLAYEQPRRVATDGSIFAAELESLESAATIARALHRTLVLPRFSCGRSADSGGAPRRECFGDTVVDIGALAAYLGPCGFVESSFFAHREARETVAQGSTRHVRPRWLGNQDDDGHTGDKDVDSNGDDDEDDDEFAATDDFGEFNGGAGTRVLAAGAWTRTGARTMVFLSPSTPPDALSLAKAIAGEPDLAEARLLRLGTLDGVVQPQGVESPPAPSSPASSSSLPASSKPPAVNINTERIASAMIATMAAGVGRPPSSPPAPHACIVLPAVDGDTSAAKKLVVRNLARAIDTAWREKQLVAGSKIYVRAPRGTDAAALIKRAARLAKSPVLGIEGAVLTHAGAFESLFGELDAAPGVAVTVFPDQIETMLCAGTTLFFTAAGADAQFARFVCRLRRGRGCVSF
jgi:hypothetical protein